MRCARQPRALLRHVDCAAVAPTQALVKGEQDVQAEIKAIRKHISEASGLSS